MDICYCGQFDPEYARNRVLIRGLRQHGIQININEAYGNKRWPWKLIQTFRGFGDACADSDTLVVGTPGYRDVPAWKIPATIRRVPLVFDAFASVYDTEVLDRKNVEKDSFEARKLWLLDRLSCGLANEVLVDTEETKTFLSSEIGVNDEKLHPIPIGADDTVFYPREDNKSDGEFRVWFHGSYIPLQGIEYIVQAAERLQDLNVIFEIAGHGQQYEHIERVLENKNINNVNQMGWVSFEEIPERIARADVCLGIFGTTEKARRVIPNKVYECIAMGKAVITGANPPSRRAFEHKSDIYLCDRGDSAALADAITTLMQNPTLRNTIGENAHRTHCDNFTPAKVAADVVEILEAQQS